MRPITAVFSVLSVLFLLLSPISFPSVLGITVAPRDGPWTRNLQICTLKDFGGQCQRFQFGGDSPKITKKPKIRWPPDGFPQEFHSFQPDKDLICRLNIKCKGGPFTKKKCDFHNIIFPGLNDVDKDFVKDTASIQCYLDGSKDSDSMKYARYQ